MKTRFTLFFIVAFFYISLATVFAQNTYYVSPTGGNIAPYNSWADAATDIQTAVDQASDGDLVLVDDGTYVLSTNVSITKGITVKSVNGYSASIVDGNNATRCFYINHADAVLDGFTVTNGYNPSALNSGHGGGILIYSAGTVQNCLVTNSQARDGGGIAINNGGLVVNSIITNNSADNNSSNGYGGGVRLLNGGTLRGSIIYGNSSEVYGGGVNIWEAGTVENCTIVYNTAPQGAGIRARNNSTIVNSIIYFNNGDNWQTSGSDFTFDYSNSTPALPGGTGNITDDPSFENTASNDFHLTSSSTLINAGLNQAWMTGAYDIDGNDRILESTVDIGAYEYLVEPSIEVTSPNSGETYTGGSTENITWISSEVTNVNIEFSSDNGANWNTVATSVDASTGSFAFTVPNISSTECLIRISDTDDANVFDVSNASFIINFTVTDPAITIGSASTVAGSYVTIPIDLTAPTGFKIDYLLQGKIHYDASKLKFLYGGYDPGMLVNDFGWTGTFYSAFPGKVNIILSGDNPINTSGTLFYLNFQVIDQNAGSTNLTSSTSEWAVDVLELPLTVVNGSVTYSATSGISTNRGDATLNYIVGVYDALAVIYHWIGLYPLNGQAFTNADVDFDGDVDIDDYLKIIFFIYFHDWDFIFPSVSPSSSVVVNNASFENSETISIPLELSNSENVQALEVEMNFDPTEFEYINTTSNLTNTGNLKAASKDGKVTLVAVNSNQLQSGTVATVRFKKLKSGSVSEISTTFSLNNGKASGSSLLSVGDGTITDVQNSENDVPKTFELSQNYPNPFNPTTVIKFAVPKAGVYQLNVYNILGQKVMTLVNQQLKAGYHSSLFDGANLASGIYIYSLHGTDVNLSRKMLLIK